jgi:hypothetical protein
MGLPATVPELVDEIRAIVACSARLCQAAPPATSPASRLAHAVWDRADKFAKAALHNAATDPPFLDVLGQIARSLWEGMVTLEYVRQRPDIRVQQMLVGALRTSVAITSSAWGKEGGVAGLRSEEVAVVEEARRREKAYGEERKGREGSGQICPGV